MSTPLQVDTVVLDVDGTLIDSNYHHTLAWWRAFRAHGHPVDAWRIHRSIGMGGDRLVAAVAGDEVERGSGDAIRDSWEKEYDAVIDEVPAFEGAAALLDALRERGFRVSLASSGIPRHTEHAMDLLGPAAHRVHSATTSEDSEESKPHPELVQVALDRVDAASAVMVGDSMWDVESGRRAGLSVVGLLSGGFGRGELEEAGAELVLDDPADLVRRLDEVVERS